MRALPFVLGLCLLAGLAGQCAEALDIQRLDVSHNGGRYRVVVEATLQADADRVRRMLLDFDALPRLNPNVSAVQARAEGDGWRVQTQLNDCLLGFCRTLLHVQQVAVHGEQFTAHTVAVDGSGFRSGEARWQVVASGADAHLSMSSDSEPDLWLPPVIGPLALTRKLREETRAALSNLERLSHE